MLRIHVLLSEALLGQVEDLGEEQNRYAFELDRAVRPMCSTVPSTEPYLVLNRLFYWTVPSTEPCLASREARPE